MTDFVYSKGCRFGYILRYFGEENDNYECGKCDSCRGDVHETGAADSYIEEIIIRTLHELKTPIKSTDLVKLLLGNSKHPGIMSNPNYGIVRHFSKEAVKNIVESLTQRGEIDNINSVLQLSEKSIQEIIGGDDESSTHENYDLHLELYSKLREIRKTASSKFTQSASLICSDEILSRISRNMPVTPSQLLSIEGVNQRMFNKFGEELLEEIKRFKEEKDVESKVIGSGLPHSSIKVYELIKKGYSLQDIVSISRLPEAVVSMQIESIIEFVKDIDISYLIEKKEFEMIRKEIFKGTFKLKELKEVLPSNISYGKIRIVLAMAKSREGSQ
jgi:ATP-dependent DNA helicase RecQ